MAEYLLFVSASPWEAAAPVEPYRLARELQGAGHDVTLYLVQNGVLAARAGAQATALDEARGVRLLADEFSLRERALPAAALRPGVAAATLEQAVDRLAGGARGIWF